MVSALMSESHGSFPLPCLRHMVRVAPETVSRAFHKHCGVGRVGVARGIHAFINECGRALSFLANSPLCFMKLEHTSPEVPPVYAVVEDYSSIWRLRAAELLL